MQVKRSARKFLCSTADNNPVVFHNKAIGWAFRINQWTLEDIEINTDGMVASDIFAIGVSIHKYKDKNVGLELMTKAANMGCPIVQNEMGWYYMEGIGLEQNIPLGISYIIMASNQEHPNALINMDFSEDFPLF